MSRAKELLYLSYYITDIRTNEQTNNSSQFLNELGGSDIIKKSQVWEIQVSTSSSKGDRSSSSNSSTSSSSSSSSKATIMTCSGGGGGGNGNGQVK